MAEQLFEKRIAVDSLPKEWEPVKVAVDWSGLPLLLMTEGKGRRPSLTAGAEAFYRWNRTPPTALHIVHLEGDTIKTTCIEKGDGLIFLDRAATLMFQSFNSPSGPQPMNCRDREGNLLTPTSIRYLRAAARGANFILNTGNAIYSLAE